MSDKQKECPGCAMMVDHKAEVCPICGYEFPKQSTSEIIVWVMIILLLLFWVVF